MLLTYTLYRAHPRPLGPLWQGEIVMRIWGRYAALQTDSGSQKRTVQEARL